MGAWKTNVDNLQAGLSKNWQDVVAAHRAMGRLGALTGGRLVKSGSNLHFERVNGLYVPIAGNLEEIPATPIQLAPTGLTPDITYLIYLALAGGVPTPEASTTAWTLDPTVGYPVKAGDASRTLIGQGRIITGPAWVDTEFRRFVRSWANRSTLAGFVAGGGSTTSVFPTFAAMTTPRVHFLAWADETIAVRYTGTVTDSTAAFIYTRTGLDGSSFAPTALALTGSTPVPIAIAGRLFVGSGEGYHFADLFGAVSTGTGTWDSTGGLTVEIHG